MLMTNADMSIREHHPLKGEKDFRWRGDQPTRVEALSDMVFAFALTLLVVSSDPPQSFADLTEQLWGFPGFAAAFTILLLIWNSHYFYFRRYALEDGWTTTLNAALLFLILFFVYPLKYLATMLSRFVQSVAEGAPSPPFSFDEARVALVIFSLAYALVFLMFALFYAHARRRADALELNAGERRLTRFSFWQQMVHVFVGLAVVAAASIAPQRIAPMMGGLYFLIGPLMFVVGAMTTPRPAKTRPAPMPQS
ncbi:integral membrane protein [alpha proteobacterium U9-1i]|nr:integral membrane protein [alpha proteobacterium U9-1i]